MLDTPFFFLLKLFYIKIELAEIFLFSNLFYVVIINI